MQTFRMWSRRLAIAAVIAGALYSYFRARSDQIAAEEAVRSARLFALRARVLTLTHSRDSLQQQLHTFKVTYQADTAHLTRWRTRWDTIKAGIETVTVADTAPRVPLGEVRTLVALADSTIQSCSVALQDCQRIGATEHARAENAESRVQLLGAMVDSLQHPLQKPRWYRWSKKAAEWLAVWRISRALR